MDGRQGHLTDEQQAALDEFQRIASGLLTEDHHDTAFCLRWLRARNFNPEAAKAMLEKSLNFRKSWRLDTILTEFKPNLGLKRTSPGGICNFDRLGGCVMIYPMANMLPKYLLEFSRRTEIIKIILHRMELGQMLLRQQTIALGRTVEANTIIFDMADFDITANLSPTALSLYCDIVGSYEANYPETLSHAFVINAPPIFNLFFKFLKPLLNGTTLSKVEIFGKDSSKWIPALLEVIHPDQLPVRYGGTLVGPQGDIRCADKIVYVDKLNNEIAQQMMSLIPKNERLIKITVGRRACHDHVVLIEEANSGLKVEFESDRHDIRFALLRRLSSQGSEKALVADKRYNSHLGSVIVSILCPVPGEYVLRFDNTYSAFRSKSVYLNVTVIPPAQVNENMLIIHEP